MHRTQLLTCVAFALGIAGLGLLAFVESHAGVAMQPVAGWKGGGALFTFASGVAMLACGAGLSFHRTTPLAVRVLLAYLAIWETLRVIALAGAPLVEASWFGIGEVAVLLAGALVIFARPDERSGATEQQSQHRGTPLRVARILFALSLLPFGLSHFVYTAQTTVLMPGWLPFHTGWAYFTGAAHIAAGIGILLSIYPRLAAILEATMVSAFTIFIWIPALVVAPRDISNWSEFLVSWAIAAAAWLVAESIPSSRQPRGNTLSTSAAQ